MGCLTLGGYTKGCEASHGGIEKIALFEKSEVDWTGKTEANGIITALQLLSGSTGATYDFLKDNSNWVQTIVGDGILTSIHWTPTITLTFRRMSARLRTEIYNMSLGDLTAIIKDWNGIYWYIGGEKGLSLSASAGSSSGSKLEELNGEVIVINGMEPQPAYTIDISSGSSVDSRILALFGF